MAKKITDFLKTKRPKKELKIALSILKEFKKCESMEEWAMIRFAAWAKFEQFEEFLEHLVNKKRLKADTKEYMKEVNQ